MGLHAVTRAVTRAVQRLPHWTVPLACALAWVLLLGAGVPLYFQRRDHSPDTSRGRVLAAPSAVASVTLPAAAPKKEAPAAANAPALPPAAPAKRLAVVVGVNHAAGHSPLQGAVTDAKNLQTALVQYGFPEGNVITLTEGAATASRILAALDMLAARSTPDGRAVFSFAGHTDLRGGVPHFVAADGGLIPASTVAAKLSRVRAPLWVALPTCYAGGYALPGIVGPNRVATFSSSADQKSYELGPAGSWLILYMVEYAMLEREAPESVEASFTYARRAIASVNPQREPFMVDNFRGDFVLGRLPDELPKPEGYRDPSDGDGVSGASSPPPSSEDAEAASPSGRRGPVRVCSGVRVGCNR